MTRRGVMRLLAAGGSVLALGGCGRASVPLRYRLSVVVDTPQGERSGFSVIEVRGDEESGLLPSDSRRARANFRGEAAAVDLPGGRTLFALLKGDGDWGDAGDYPITAFGGLQGSTLVDRLDELSSSPFPFGMSAPLGVEEEYRGELRRPLPMLVTFRDIRDPTSVERVNPQDLSATFGTGVALKGVMVAITDDPVTTGIDKRLGWLRNFYGQRLDGQRYGDGSSFANALSSGVFSTEAAK